MTSWIGRKKRNLYRFESVPAISVASGELSTCPRWLDIDYRFGKHRSQSFEIMWEIIVLFSKMFCFPLKVRGSLLQQRAK